MVAAIEEAQAAQTDNKSGAKGEVLSFGNIKGTAFADRPRAARKISHAALDPRIHICLDQGHSPYEW